MRAPVLVIPGRERFHEVTLNVWAFVLGIAFIVGAPQPGSMAALVDQPWRVVFSVALASGGGISLLGCYWLSDVERGLELERAGLVMLTGALLIYVVAVFSFVGWSGLFAAGISFAWGWANVRRSVGITADLNTIRRNEGP